jgi:hypothetical protein
MLLYCNIRFEVTSVLFISKAVLLVPMLIESAYGAVILVNGSLPADISAVNIRLTSEATDVLLIAVLAVAVFVLVKTVSFVIVVEAVVDADVKSLLFIYSCVLKSCESFDAIAMVLPLSLYVRYSFCNLICDTWLFVSMRSKNKSLIIYTYSDENEEKLLYTCCRLVALVITMLYVLFATSFLRSK